MRSSQNIIENNNDAKNNLLRVATTEDVEQMAKINTQCRQNNYK